MVVDWSDKGPIFYVYLAVGCIMSMLLLVAFITLGEPGKPVHDYGGG